jgi:hypothetical protein
MQTDLVAGDSLNYETQIVDYPPSAGWTAKLRMAPIGAGAPVSVTANAVAETDSYRWQVGPGVTGAWSPGVYGWAIWVERAGERYTQQMGRLTVTQDPATASAGIESRSQAERSLDAINALLEGRAATAQLRYKINGRELESYPLKDLLLLKSHFEAAVANERRAQGLSDPRGGARRILVRMR